MIYSFHRERTITDTIPADNGLVTFDVPLVLSETQVPLTDTEIEDYLNTHGSSEGLPEYKSEPDFIYNEDGTVDILRAGNFSIFWFIAKGTSLSAKGQRFEIKKRINAPTTEEATWIPIAGSSNHISFASSSGFAVFDVTDQEVDVGGSVSIGLFNSSEAEVILTPIADPKAGLMVWGVELDSLVKRLEIVEDFIDSTDYWEIPSPTYPGIVIGVLRTGKTYNFWGMGAYDGSLGEIPQVRGQSYEVIPASLFLPLGLYIGDPTYGTMFQVRTYASSSEAVSPAMPIMFDGTGIRYIYLGEGNGVMEGTEFKFTQPLILAYFPELSPSPAP